jgi:hypothetical protein
MRNMDVTKKPDELKNLRNICRKWYRYNSRLARVHRKKFPLLTIEATVWHEFSDRLTLHVRTAASEDQPRHTRTFTGGHWEPFGGIKNRPIHGHPSNNISVNHHHHSKFLDSS